MGVHIHDLSDPNRSIRANWWQWRPTVELIKSFDLFDEERMDVLSNGFGEFSADETQTIISRLEAFISSHLMPGDRLLLDGRVTSVPDDGTFYRTPSEQHQNYSADYVWLVNFVAFCKQCEGIYVS